jgi:dihydrofolate synthase/folylpolyglutamate synthase
VTSYRHGSDGDHGDHGEWSLQRLPLDFGDALAWLDSHQNMEQMLADTRLAVPDPGRVRGLMDLLGDPQDGVPVIQITGTNGKTSTARALTQLLMAKGLTVGTFISPHLQQINERISFNGEAITNEELAELLSSIAALEPLLEGHQPLTWFEILAAAAYRWFAERPVEVAVVEVGMGGRWDATSVANPSVSVVTNVGLDHVELLGPTLADIAREKAGVARADGVLVLGETSPELVPIFEAEQPGQLLLRDRDFACTYNQLAVGGRLMDLRTPLASYTDVFLALHGSHQADNFACALAAAEAFFGAPLGADLVAEAAAQVRSPGRLEILRRQPLVVLDGAKNLDGARSAARALNEEFGDEIGRILVVGMLRGKDPLEMLQALEADRSRLVVACLPPSPRARPAEDIAEAASLIGVQSVVCGPVDEALDFALQEVAPDELILVTGSLYVVGAARSAFGR